MRHFATFEFPREPPDVHSWCSIMCIHATHLPSLHQTCSFCQIFLDCSCQRNNVFLEIWKMHPPHLLIHFKLFFFKLLFITKISTSFSLKWPLSLQDTHCVLRAHEAFFTYHSFMFSLLYYYSNFLPRDVQCVSWAPSSFSWMTQAQRRPRLRLPLTSVPGASGIRFTLGHLLTYGSRIRFRFLPIFFLQR